MTEISKLNNYSERVTQLCTLQTIKTSQYRYCTLLRILAPLNFQYSEVCGYRIAWLGKTAFELKKQIG